MIDQTSVGDLSMIEQDKAAGAKMAGGAVLTTLTGITLNEWVAVLTIVYFILQIGLLVPKYILMYKTWKEKKRGKQT